MFTGLLKNTFAVLCVFSLEVILYSVLIEPKILDWGATVEESQMTLIGDNDQEKIISTRAITINAPKENVWRWLMQLGADRAGFFSYEFIESALGYETRFPSMALPQFDDFKKNDLIRGSLDEARSVIPYNFEVLNVIPQNTFVLDNWGSFLITSISDNKTRLLIRTQEPKRIGVFGFIKHHLIAPFHYVMERRTLYGVKMKAEKDNRFTHMRDKVWFSSILISWCMILALAFVVKGNVKKIIMPTVLGFIWLINLFILPPLPVYSTLFLLMMCLIVYISLKKRFLKSKIWSEIRHFLYKTVNLKYEK